MGSVGHVEYILNFKRNLIYDRNDVINLRNLPSSHPWGNYEKLPYGMYLVRYNHHFLVDG